MLDHINLLRVILVELSKKEQLIISLKTLIFYIINVFYSIMKCDIGFLFYDVQSLFLIYN